MPDISSDCIGSTTRCPLQFKVCVTPWKDLEAGGRQMSRWGKTWQAREKKEETRKWAPEQIKRWKEVSKKARRKSKQQMSTWKKMSSQKQQQMNKQKQILLHTFQAVDGDKFICMDSYTARDCLVYSFGIRSDKPTSFQIQKYIYVQHTYVSEWSAH